LYPSIVTAFKTIHEQTRGSGSSGNIHPQQQQKYYHPQQKQKQKKQQFIQHQQQQHQQQQQSQTSSTFGTTALPTSNTVGPGIPAMIINDDDYSSNNSSNSLPRSQQKNSSKKNSKNNSKQYNMSSRHTVSDMTPVRLYSIEVWNVETNQLVGGELGYSVGAIYSSLTGYSDQESAGSVQLTALGCLLIHCGFEYWDLGMELEYKRRLGAQLMPRDEFVATVKRSRVENKNVILQLPVSCSSNSNDDCDGGVQQPKQQKQNAKELIDLGKKKKI
jgi:hypothetical protein